MSNVEEIPTDTAFFRFNKEFGTGCQRRLWARIKKTGKDGVTLSAGGAVITLTAHPQGNVTLDNAFMGRLSDKANLVTDHEFTALTRLLCAFKDT